MIQNAVQSHFPTGPSEFFVDPEHGSDQATGDRAHPYKTITQALQQAVAGAPTIIRLHPGLYSAESGEQFPLRIPDKVSLLKPDSDYGEVVIRGGGSYTSPTFEQQTIALLLGNYCQLRGVTVSNPAAKGTGIWIESTSPTIANCTVVDCGREGIFVTGTAHPTIHSSVFRNNTASGITLVRHAKGEVRGNLCRKTGFGIVMSDHAAPLLTDNQLLENRAGIVLSGAARPVLRQNQIEHNSEDGLAVFGRAVPDLGSEQDPGGNLFRENGKLDLRHAAVVPLVSVGNQLNPLQISGAVELRLNRAFPLPPVVGVGQPPGDRRPAATDSLPPADANWATEFIQALKAERLLNHFLDAAFKPAAYLSRAEYATWVARAFQQPEVHPAQGFVDVPAHYWAAAAIAQAQRMGFLSGFPDQTFRPEEPLGRLPLISSLVRGLKLTAGPGSLDRYRDRAQIPSQATSAVAAATQHRLVVLYPPRDRLHPWEPVTKAEAAVMLYQALVTTGRAPAIASPYIVQPAEPEPPSQASEQTLRVVLDPGHGGSDSGSVGMVAPRQSSGASGSAGLPPQPGPALRPAASQFGSVPRSPFPTNLRPPANSPEREEMPLTAGPAAAAGRFAAPLHQAGPRPAAAAAGPLPEKDIVLPIAKTVAALLARHGVEVVLTRTQDDSLDSAARIQIAEQAQADVFVSLHANATQPPQPEVNGLETYHAPRSVEAARLAHAIHRTLVQRLNFADRGVRPATFYTLRLASMPAVLVEMGYLTGQRDGPNLANPLYRDRLAEAIADAILDYLRQAQRADFADHL